ncbi:MAG: hypothetical protein FD164_1385 [Nitrospirae bacterium]|nr:MAG: hypothetical protein FD164_1385 [Nitrospirota bacterium]
MRDERQKFRGEQSIFKAKRPENRGRRQVGMQLQPH